ncbi:MAG TPA: ribose 5-phosphate isomerase B [Planctomycetaceae bacterium]|nr:ribose 5-phosphate isomerase B [Planctomycetaceae bacterium]
MKIAIASDHRGYDLKARLVSQIEGLGHEVHDYGTDSADCVDYPDYAAKVAEDVASGRVDRGILVCGTGLGMCIVANKFPGVRAVSCHDAISAEISRRHNDANVLCLSGELLSDAVVTRMVETWLKTEFEGGRHARRLAKIEQIEMRHLLGGSARRGEPRPS